MLKEEKQQRRMILSGLEVPKNPSFGPLQSGPRFRPTQIWGLWSNFILWCHSLQLLYFDYYGPGPQDLGWVSVEVIIRNHFY